MSKEDDIAPPESEEASEVNVAGVPGERKPVVNIENIVATVILENTLDLNLIEARIPDVDYNPDQFPGLVYRLQSPKITALVFKSGKMVVTGAKSVKQLVWAVKAILKKFITKGIVIQGRPQIQIQNIVASANLNVVVDLEKAAFVLPHSMYEPEQFPGLMCRMSDSKAVILLFSSGSLVCAGAKGESEVHKAVEKLQELIENKGLLYRQG